MNAGLRSVLIQRSWFWAVILCGCRNL